MRIPLWASPPSIAGAKPAPDVRSPEPDSGSLGRLSFQQKYLRFAFFSTPSSWGLKPDASQRSSESKPKTLFSPSFQQKDVLLLEWWLIKTKKVYNGRRLAVGGFTKCGEIVETFTSAPITKRHDYCTLETADGVIVRLIGPINKARTFENGFPFEVSAIFLFGFPATWDSSTAVSSEDKPSNQPIMGLQPETTFEPSSQKKTVCLRNWWLRKTEKVEGSNIAVGGFDEFGKAMRVYNSSPITKRHDVYTLETADGISIRIQGFINKTRTLDNGFSLEVCKAFLIGFPTTWTDFVNNSSRSTTHQEVIPEFVVQGSLPNSVCMPLIDNRYHHLQGISKSNNDPIQVDDSCGTKMRTAEAADKEYENHEANSTPVSNSCIEGLHSEDAGCQISEIDSFPQEKLMNDAKLFFIQDTTLKNSKKCSGDALTKGLGDEMVTGVCSDSVIGKGIHKGETAKKKDEKSCERSIIRSDRLRSRLSKSENLHDVDQKFPKPSANPVKETKKVMFSEVRNVQGDFQCLDKTIIIDSAKFAPNGSETSAISQLNKILVEESPSSSNTYRKDQTCDECSPKLVTIDRIGLTTLGNVHGEFQDCSMFVNDVNNLNCSNIAPDGSNTTSIGLPSCVLVEGSPSLSKLNEGNQKFADSSAKPVRRSERLLLARLGNVHVNSHNYSQLLDDTYGTNCATFASKTSGTILSNCTILTGSLSSSMEGIPVPSTRCMLEENEDVQQHCGNLSKGVASKVSSVSKFGPTLTHCLWQSLNEQRTTCDRVVSQLEGTPSNSKAFTSTSGKNIMPDCSKKKDIRTVRSRTMVDQSDLRYQEHFTSPEETISISCGSISRSKMKSVGGSTGMKKPKSKEPSTSGHRIIWVSSYANVHRTPSNQRNPSILTPESLNLKRSRSGRLLLPTLDCSTRVIYEADGSIAGTASVDGSTVGTSRVSMSLSQRKGLSTFLAK